MHAVCLSVSTFSCLPVCLPVSMFSCLPVSKFSCLPVCLPVSMFYCLSVSTFSCLPVCLPVSMFSCLSISIFSCFLCPHVRLPACLFACCLPISVSACLLIVQLTSDFSSHTMPSIDLTSFFDRKDIITSQCGGRLLIPFLTCCLA